ncbi:MAG: HupE/UreJ family protein, partial [Myxococcota bacterium]|nr:HupE/UreJ family protein [Myxococcota bacterium]
LLHGLGFAGALRDAGLPHGAVLEALVGFNVGVELGQLAFVGVCLALFAIAARLRVPERRSREAAVLAIGGAAAYFLIDRLGALGGGA